MLRFVLFFYSYLIENNEKGNQTQLCEDALGIT